MKQGEAPPVNVLVVDDDEDTSALLGLLLGRHGWGATFAADLEEARSALGKSDISALVTDVHLPDGSGLSLLANGRPPTLRAAVVITGWGGEEERRESKRSGFDAYFVKPFDGVQLVRILQHLLEPEAGAAGTGLPTDLAQNLLSKRAEQIP